MNKHLLNFFVVFSSSTLFGIILLNQISTTESIHAQTAVISGVEQPLVSEASTTRINILPQSNTLPTPVTTTVTTTTTQDSAVNVVPEPVLPKPAESREIKTPQVNKGKSPNTYDRKERSGATVPVNEKKSEEKIEVTTPPRQEIIQPVNTVQSVEAVTTASVYRLKPPTSFSANKGLCSSTAIRLSWQPSEGATSYRLLRNGVKIYEGQEYSFFDSNLTLDTEYAYSVSAHYSYVSSESIHIKLTSPKECEKVIEVVAPIQSIPTHTATNSQRDNVTPKTETPKNAIPPARIDVPATALPPQNVAPVKPVAEIDPVAAKVQDLAAAIDTAKSVVDSSKDEIRKIIDSKITKTLKDLKPDQVEVITEELQSRRNKLIDEVNTDLKDSTVLSPEDISSIKLKVNKGISDIDVLISEKIIREEQKTATTDIQTSTIKNVDDVRKVLDTLVVEARNSAIELKEQGIDLLYKDTNKDGISDYESTHVYNIDPIAPSPVSTFEGRQVTAGEKIILGLDPAKSEVVKVVPEEPKASLAPLATTYKVNKVSLSEEKKVVLKGTALPNSYVTLYIYSTPIIVTVKTDKDGEWQYVVDKELESGEHTIYTATVNNTGKILTQSSGFQFVKTAEAATLGSLPSIQVTSEIQKPGLLNRDILLTIGVMFLIITVLSLIAIGVYSKNTNQTINE